MEFAMISGAIALLGYGMSSKKEQYTDHCFQQNEEGEVLYDEPKSAEDLVNEFNQKVAEHIENKQTIIGGVTNMHDLPFFSSAKTMNTNNTYKNRRLETLTGVENVDFNHKKEVILEPPERDINNIYGVTFQPDIERYKDFTSVFPHNNVSATEKVYVGPGLGIPAEQSAAGGFHQYFRVLPDNVNGYRKNNLPGRMNHGYSQVDHTQNNDFNYNLNRPHLDPMAQNCRPFDNKKMAEGQAVTSRPDVSVTSLCNNRGNTSCLMGSANQSGAGNYVDSDYTHKDEKVTYCYNGNPQASGLGTGAYHTSKYLESFTGNRETPFCETVNIQRENAGTYQYARDILPTQRGNDCTELYGHAQHNNAGIYNQHGTTIRPTQREGLQCDAMSYMGPSHANGPTNRVEVDNIKETQRGKQCDNFTGSALASVPLSYQHYGNNDAFMKKEMTLVSDYEFNGQKPNVKLGHEDIGCNTRVFKNETCDEILTHGVSKNTNNITNTSQTGSVNVGNKLQVENTRTVFGYVGEQLKDNPFSIDITNNLNNKM